MTESFEHLAHEINARLARGGDDHRLAAGLRLHEAKALVKAGGGRWGEWCAAHINRSRGDIIRLMARAAGTRLPSVRKDNLPARAEKPADPLVGLYCYGIPTGAGKRSGRVIAKVDAKHFLVHPSGTPQRWIFPLARMLDWEFVDSQEALDDLVSLRTRQAQQAHDNKEAELAQAAAKAYRGYLDDAVARRWREYQREREAELRLHEFEKTEHERWRARKEQVMQNLDRQIETREQILGTHHGQPGPAQFGIINGFYGVG